jgi:ABC-2 type transport system permease protein
MEVSQIIKVAVRDLNRMWKYRWWLAGLVAMNLSDLFIMATIFNGVVNRALIPDYIKFVAPGITAIAIFASSFSIGREVMVEIRRDVHHYLLSLPMRRYELLLGRALGGTIRGLVYAIPFLILLIAIEGLPNVEIFSVALISLILLAFSMSSLGIALSSISRQMDVQATVRSLLYFVLFFFSTVFYPSRAISQFSAIRLTSHYNPVSVVADLLRASFGEGVMPAADQLISLPILSFLMSVAGMLLYMKAMAK